jgi:hypothetical protein
VGRDDFLRHLATINGQRSTYDVLLIDRWEGDKLVETWSLRAGEPQPISGRKAADDHDG